MKTKQLSDLKPMTGDVKPISVDERLGRLDKARRLMRENGYQAMFLDVGSGLRYFTGIDHWPSERMIAAIVMADGGLTYICPAFEEMRFREMLLIEGEVRVWEEHESPYERVAQALADHGIRNGRIGMEEGVRYFLFDGVRQAAPHLEFTSADAITIPCRAHKSSA